MEDLSSVIGLIHHEAYRCFERLPSRSTIEYDDLVQEGMVVFVEIQPYWKPDLGTKFSTYLCMSLRNKFCSILDNACHKREYTTPFIASPDTDALPLDVPEPEHFSMSYEECVSLLARISDDSKRFLDCIFCPSLEFQSFYNQWCKERKTWKNRIEKAISAYLGLSFETYNMIVEELRDFVDVSVPERPNDPKQRLQPVFASAQPQYAYA